VFVKCGAALLRAGTALARQPAPAPDHARQQVMARLRERFPDAPDHWLQAVALHAPALADAPASVQANDQPSRPPRPAVPASSQPRANQPAARHPVPDFALAPPASSPSSTQMRATARPRPHLPVFAAAPPEPPRMPLKTVASEPTPARGFMPPTFSSVVANPAKRTAAASVGWASAHHTNPPSEQSAESHPTKVPPQRPLAHEVGEGGAQPARAGRVRADAAEASTFPPAGLTAPMSAFAPPAHLPAPLIQFHGPTAPKQPAGEHATIAAPARPSPPWGAAFARQHPQAPLFHEAPAADLWPALPPDPPAGPAAASRQTPLEETRLGRLRQAQEAL